MAQTWKLATILAADVSGYSKLAAAAEERTLRGCARSAAIYCPLSSPCTAATLSSDPAMEPPRVAEVSKRGAAP